MRQIRRPCRIVPPLLAVLASAFALGCSPGGDAMDAKAMEVVPTFETDPDWPVDLPANWVFGPGTGIYVDARDHVWILHRPERITPEDMAAVVRPGVTDCCVPAPPLIELDPSGRMVQSLGSIEKVDDWPYFPHSVFVDHNDFVWVGAAPHHIIMKFTRDGRYQFTIGEFDRTGGSADTSLLGGAADMWVDPETNELFVADGYENRRVVVFDAATGTYLRHWGAYGERPDDAYEYAGTDGIERQFQLAHGLAGSKDGLIYLADATNSRIQVFRRNGEFVREASMDNRPISARITDVAFSEDPEQQFLYVADGRDDKVWILRRADLEVLGQFGGSGAEYGQFGRPHNIATDSRGNIYVAEAHPGRRFQKFDRRGGLVP